MSKRRLRFSDLYVLTIIFAVATFLRFYELSDRGLIYWDEAKFALEGIRVQVALQGLLGSHITPSLGKAVGSAKPTHALLIALAYFLLGVHDYSPLLLSAMASALQVPLIYLIARRLFSPAIGLISALLLAVSEYESMYARSALSESDATLFLLAGVLVWTYSIRDFAARGDRATQALTEVIEPEAGRRRAGTLVGPYRDHWVDGMGYRSRCWSCAAAGFFMGVGFTANYRLIVYIVALVGFDVLWQRRQVGRRPAASRLLAWLVGLAVPPLLWQGADLLARAHRFVLFQGDLTHERSWYLGQVVYQLHEGKQAVVHFEPLLYIQWYVSREGWLMLVLLVLGLGLSFWRRSFSSLAVAVPVALPYLAYTFAPFVVPRNIEAAIPFASIVVAATVGTLASQIPSRKLAKASLVLIALLLAALCAAMSWRLTVERSGFSQAAAYVERHGSRRALTSSEVMLFYFRGSGARCDAPSLPSAISGLASYVRAGYRFAVLDRHHTSPITTFIKAHTQRVARYLALGPLSLDESPIASENSSPPGTSPRLESVDVFWLGGIDPKSRGTGPLAPCNRDYIV